MLTWLNWNDLRCTKWKWTFQCTKQTVKTQCDVEAGRISDSLSFTRLHLSLLPSERSAHHLWRFYQISCQISGSHSTVLELRPSQRRLCEFLPGCLWQRWCLHQDEDVRQSHRCSVRLIRHRRLCFCPKLMINLLKYKYSGQLSISWTAVVIDGIV